MGLERAGWRTVSFSEIDPYACAILAERWPGVPNLGDITELAGIDGTPRPFIAEGRRHGPVGGGVQRATPERDASGLEREPRDWRDAALWSGGFPCQDLSIAGKRRGLAGERSGLAHTFLGLVERHRPPWVLLENVPGLLSSHRGRDLSVLLGRLSELGYGVAGRVLDARYFGVAQRRRRVFLLATRDPSGRAGALRAAEVLSLAAGGDGHPATGGQEGPGATRRPRYGIDLARAITGTSGKRHDDDTDTLIPIAAAIRGNPYGDHISAESHLTLGPSPDAGRDGAPDGLAGRAHHRGLLADTGIVQALDAKGGGPDDNEAQAGQLIVGFMPYRTLEADGSVTSGFAERDISDALHGPTGNKEPLVISVSGGDRRAEVPEWRRDVASRMSEQDDASIGALLEASLLPLGLDSHRYRVCGNGVVSNVAEAIGRALIAVTEREAAA